MDPRDTTEEASFRAEARSWLADNVPAEWESLRGCVGGHTSLEEFMGAEEALRFQRAWHAKLFEAGFIGLSWPKRFGGRELLPTFQFIWQEEYAKARPPPMINVIGLGWTGPAIMTYGTTAQQERFLPKILSGEEVWCQLFSEPGAGSDLAALRTRATLHDDTFVVNGQKVWTTIARDAQWGILLARTDADSSKHAGISFLLCDMSDPGIEIRPIRQMNGSAEFNEVFFTDVRIPRSHLVGDLHGGWEVAIATLQHERIGLSLAPGSLWGQGPTIDDLLVHLDELSAWDDVDLRQRGAAVFADSVAHRMLKLRLVTDIVRGREPGAGASIQKLFGDELGQRLNELAVDAQGLHALRAGFWQGTYLFSQALTIGGGTTEVQKNIIGERILGLPREPTRPS